MMKSCCESVMFLFMCTITTSAVFTIHYDHLLGCANWAFSHLVGINKNIETSPKSQKLSAEFQCHAVLSNHREVYTTWYGKRKVDHCWIHINSRKKPIGQYMANSVPFSNADSCDMIHCVLILINCPHHQLSESQNINGLERITHFAWAYRRCVLNMLYSLKGK